MNVLVNIVLSVEFATLMVALFYVNKHKQKYFKYFIAYAAVIFIVEYIGNVLIKKNNGYVYDIYTFFEFNLVAIIYYHLNKEKFSLRVIKYMTVIFNVIYFLSFYFDFLQRYIVVTLAFILSLFMILYFKELLSSNKIINYRKNLSFWITTGMLFYYLTTIPYLALVYITDLTNDYANFIIRLITVATHLCFITGIICSQKKVN